MEQPPPKVLLLGKREREYVEWWHKNRFPKALVRAYSYTYTYEYAYE